MTKRDDVRAFFSHGIEENMDALYGVALRLTGSGADAEDLVAESVAKAWSAINTLEDRSRFRPWIFRILRNRFISDYRKKSIRPTESSYQEENSGEGGEDIVSLLNEQTDEFLHWWANPEREFFNDILGESILAAVGELPDVFRTTVLLVNVEGLTYDEAAEALGVPPGTVRSRMKRGRTLLQKALWRQAREAGLQTRNKETSSENAQ
jgi:RNA polymerase sigma-70 factor (ECF subfamily)